MDTSSHESDRKAGDGADNADAPAACQQQQQQPSLATDEPLLVRQPKEAPANHPMEEEEPRQESAPLLQPTDGNDVSQSMATLSSDGNDEHGGGGDGGQELPTEDEGLDGAHLPSLLFIDEEEEEGDESRAGHDVVQGGDGRIFTEKVKPEAEEESDDGDADMDSVSHDTCRSTSSSSSTMSSSLFLLHDCHMRHHYNRHHHHHDNNNNCNSPARKQAATELLKLPLIDYLCGLNNGCSVRELHTLLQTKSPRAHMLAHLQQRCLLRTVHLRPTERNITLHAHALSALSTNLTFACGGYLNLTVRQYFYAKHGVRLRHPNLPALVERGGGAHMSYYPLECVQVHVMVASPTDPNETEDNKEESAGCADDE